MSECKVNELTKQTDTELPRKFTDEELVRYANIQASDTSQGHTGPTASASQRAYNRAVRREIRRRGLDWKPPGLGT